jgi:hypothetical protein
MFGWGKRRGSDGRAYDNNIVIIKDPDPKKGKEDKNDPDSPKPNSNGNHPRPIVPRSPVQLAIAVSFAVGLTITIGGIALALAFQIGTAKPLDVNVDHILGSCLYGDPGIADMAARAQQMLPLKRSSRSSSKPDSDVIEEGTGSAITIYVPCPSRDDYDDDEGGYDRGDDSGDGGGGYYLRRSPDDVGGGSQ